VPLFAFLVPYAVDVWWRGRSRRAGAILALPLAGTSAQGNKAGQTPPGELARTTSGAVFGHTATDLGLVG
jgi:hypothetical protein